MCACQQNLPTGQFSVRFMIAVGTAAGTGLVEFGFVLHFLTIWKRYGYHFSRDLNGGRAKSSEV